MLLISVVPTNQRPSQGAAAIFEGRVQGIFVTGTAAQDQTLQDQDIIKAAGQLSKRNWHCHTKARALLACDVCKSKVLVSQQAAFLPVVSKRTARYSRHQQLKKCFFVFSFFFSVSTLVVSPLIRQCRPSKDPASLSH